MKTLYCGLEIPTVINTNERIFKIETFDGEIILCNLAEAKYLLQLQNIKRLFHYWNYDFKPFDKLTLKTM